MPKVKKGLIFFVLCKLGIFDVDIIMLPDPGRSYIDFGSKWIMSFTSTDAAWVADYEKETGESVSFFWLAEDRRKLNVQFQIMIRESQRSVQFYEKQNLMRQRTLQETVGMKTTFLLEG